MATPKRQLSDGQKAWRIGQLLKQEDAAAWAAEEEALDLAWGMRSERRRDLALKRIADRMTTVKQP